MSAGRGENDERSMFAEELIAMRNQRGWTQEEAAAKMLLSTSTIANIESGYRAPTQGPGGAGRRGVRDPGDVPAP